MKKRKTYSGTQKFEAAIALIKREKSAVEIAREVGCHPNIVTEWRDNLLAHGSIVFERGNGEARKDRKIEKLERMIGKITVQNDFLEKVLERYGSK